ncbi:hypothetical protein PSN13_06500 [Micromonospora saelicesensis]|uniref:Uncharacterized protein n=1 Tax=Micromonospora saelicesensis TaxID=285676 RepID=A0A328NF87_9ACTN|nr:hypothetical protein [Micromonospora saelicesensis]RAO26472.1 hypothetical protein PSN13_06500 [Micromonospora saelicesensis]
MPDLVRIRDPKTNTEFSVGARRAEQLVERGAELVKDGAAGDRLGRSLPATDTTTKTAKTSKEQAR